MPPLKVQYLDGPRLRRSLVAACDHAQLQRGELNRINVFPVPDGDTGTNLALTVRAIADHLRPNRDRRVSVIAHEAAQAAVLGARGNCGMMLSHFLLGFAEDLSGLERIDTARFARALEAGASRLSSALEKPIEGTILTVIRDTADAAGRSGVPDFVPLIEQLVHEARGSLRRTPDLLPVLRKAGVVDAGAKGFVSLLEGVLLFVNGDPLVAIVAADNGDDAAVGARAAYPTAEERYRFCTEALVRGPDLPTQSEVRSALRDVGDSLIVIRADEVLKVHVHTDDPEGVFEYLRGLGPLVTHKAEDMLVQHATLARSADGHVLLARRPVSIVTDSASDLSEEILRAHGIHVTPLVLIDGERTYRDGVDISADEFHGRIARAEQLPTTSQPAPADFLDCFARAAEEGETVLGVLVGSTLSGTFASAEAAAQRFHGAPVFLCDSLGASLLEGLLTLKAAELAELGTPAAAILEELARVRGQSGILFTVDTFDRLIASGRVGRGRALLGRFLGIKPILDVTPEGRVVPVGKALGSPRARDRLLEILRSRVREDAEKVRFGIVHVGTPEIVQPVMAALRAEYGAHVEVLSAPATPVIATHLGIGAWGIAYIVED